jgi:serine/threonine protein kinase
LTGHWCFNLTEVQGVSKEEYHLASMVALTGEIFDDEMWQQAQLRDQFFVQGAFQLLTIHLCSLSYIHRPSAGELRCKVAPTTLEEAIAKHDVLDPDDASAAADFIRSCFHLNPPRRPSAEELLSHQWVVGADSMDNYRPVPEKFRTIK